MKRTKNETRVLEILLRYEGPMTAYEILDEMRAFSPKAAPTTVYRALKGLVESGRAHRLESLNAFVPCRGDTNSGHSIMSICSDCGKADESVSHDLFQDLAGIVAKSGFSPKCHVVEVHGVCSACGEEGTSA